MMAPENPLSHVIQHPLKEIPADLGLLTPKGVITVLSDQIVMMIVAGFLLALLVPVLVRRRAGTDAVGRLVPTGFANFFETVCEYLRKEIAEPVLGVHTDRFIRYVWSAFFFVLTVNILGLLPVISQMRQQIDSINLSMSDAFGIAAFLKRNQQPIAASETAAPDAAAQSGGSTYAERIGQVLAMLREEFDKPIIILYHSGVTLLPDGQLQIDRDMRYYDDFKTACERNGIVFLDVGDAFLRAYEADHSLPYGFQNTTMPSGHLNTLGHKIVAEEFYKAWMQIQDKENN